MTSGKRLAVAAGIGLVTLFGSLSAAEAQYRQRPYYGAPPPARYGVYRDGLTLGGALGLGAILSDNCGPYCGAAGMFEGHIGGMLTPRVALMGDFWGSGHRWDDGAGTGTTYHGLYTLAVQYWATNILWLKGGIGFAQLNYGYDGTVTPDENGPGMMGAIGVEVVQGPSFALDLQFRFGHGFYDLGPDVNNVGFMVGLNWY
jgi:hypothetical protein